MDSDIKRIFGREPEEMVIEIEPSFQDTGRPADEESEGKHPEVWDPDSPDRKAGDGRPL